MEENNNIKEVSGETEIAYDKVRKIHKQVFTEMMAYKDSLSYLNNEEAYNNIKKVVDYFKEKVLYHFDWEEQKVFPIALAIGDLNYKQIVRELQMQHILIISKFDIIADIIFRYGFSFTDEKIKNEFIRVSKEMIGLILQHAQKEDADLFPFLENKGIKLDLRNGGRDMSR